MNKVKKSSPLPSAVVRYSLTGLFVFLPIIGCKAPPQKSDVSIHEAESIRCPADALACAKAFDSTLSRVEPFSRFDSRISYLEGRLRGLRSYEEIIEAVDSQKVRKTLMQLQGLFKIYEGIPASRENLKIIEEGRQDVKALEDAIGGLQRAEDVLKRSRKGGVSKEILTVLEDEYRSAQIKVVEDLKAADWLPFPMRHLSELRQNLARYEYKKKPKDQKLQIQSLLDLLKNYRKDLAGMEPYFAPMKYTERDLEKGVHSARRGLRWVMAILQSSQGLYFYKEEPALAREINELNQLYGDSQYVELSPPMKGAVGISKFDVLSINKFVVEYGALKDFKESQLDLRNILLKHKLVKSEKEAEEIAFNVMKAKFGDLNVEAKAQELHKDYLLRDPLKRLRELLEESLVRLDEVPPTES